MTSKINATDTSPLVFMLSAVHHDKMYYFEAAGAVYVHCNLTDTQYCSKDREAAA